MNEPATTTTMCLSCSGRRPLSPADEGGVVHAVDRRPALTWRPCPSFGWGEHEDADNSPLDVLSQDVRDLVDVLTAAGVPVAIGSLSSFACGQVALLVRNLADEQLLVWLNPAADPEDQLAVLPAAWRDALREPGTWSHAVRDPGDAQIACRAYTVV